MKVIIPAKENSTRVPNKNWREFYEGISLTQIKIEQLLQCFQASDIFLSCDQESRRSISDHYGINFHLRESVLASDDTAWSEAVTGILEDLPIEDSEDILWTEVTSPLFSDYSALIRTWEDQKGDHDSLLTVKSHKEFFFSKNGQPVNFQFGKWHRSSQDLDPLYSMDASFIIQKALLLSLQYPIGRHPYFFVLEQETVEIDTPLDFKVAQELFVELKRSKT